MTRPRAGEHGDQAHLTWGTVRWSMARQMRLLVDVVGPSRQYAAILAGHDVELTADQVRSFVPPDRRPLALDEHDVWVLRDDELTPLQE